VWINPDASDPQLAAKSALALPQELEWASFLGLQAVLVTPPPNLDRAVNFSRIINRALEGLTNMAIWVQLPLGGAGKGAGSRKKQQAGGGGGGEQQQQAGAAAAAAAAPAAARDSWDDWQQLFALCERSNLLGAVLEVPADLPPPPLVKRWLGQPLKALLLPTHVFTTNKRGYPVLSHPHQELVSLAFKHSVQIVVTGASCHRVAPTPTPVVPLTPAAAATAVAAASGAAGADAGAGATGAPGDAGAAGVVEGFPIVNPGESHPLRPYWEYLCYLFRRVEDLSPAEVLESTYRDYLQVCACVWGWGGVGGVVTRGGQIMSFVQSS